MAKAKAPPAAKPSPRRQTKRGAGKSSARAAKSKKPTNGQSAYAQWADILTQLAQTVTDAEDALRQAKRLNNYLSEGKFPTKGWRQAEAVENLIESCHDRLQRALALAHQRLRETDAPSRPG